MPKLPIKLIVFTIAFGFFWIHMAPKRAELARRILGRKRDAAFEDSIKVLVEAKVRADICTWEDICEYRSQSWEAVGRTDAYGAEAVHVFSTDGKPRKFLFRIRNGLVSEVIDMR